MAIGNVKFQGTPQQYSQPQVSASSFGAGVGVALKGLGASIGEVTGAAEERRRRSELFATDVAWAEVQGEWNREQLDVLQNAPETGAGMTNSRYDSLEAKRQEFLGTLSPEMRERMSATTQIAVENLTSSTYEAEFTLNNNYETRAIADTINEAAGGLIAGTTTLEGALSTAGILITSSNLSDTAKAVALDAMEEDLLAASFHRELSQAQSAMGPTRDPNDKEVVAAGMSPAQVGILDAIATDESNGEYNIRWNGPGNAPAYFTDFSDHPRIYVDNGDGDVSSAAGRYQFTAETWDDLPARFRQGGFTPANQDRAALYLAEQRYNAQLSRDEPTFNEIINGGTNEQLLGIRDRLAPTWAAFHNMSDVKFIQTFRQGQGGAGTGSSEVPDVWTDPQYAGLSVERRMQMENDARVTSNNILNQQQQALESNAEQLRIAFAAGDPTAQLMATQAMQAGQVPIDTYAEFLKLGKEDRIAKEGGESFYTDMTSGTSLANNADNQANALDFFTRNGIFEGVQNLDPEAGQMLTQSFAQSGVMPAEVSDLLMSMYNSPNPQTMSYGMGLLAEMQAKGRNQFGAAMPEEIVEATTAWNLATKYSNAADPSAVMSRFQEFRSPEQRELRATYTEEAETLLMDIPTEEILDEFRTWFDRNNMQVGPDNRAGIRSSAVLAPRDPASLAAFRTDANKLFTQYYPLFQDQDQTMEFVTEMMGNSWGADATGGSNVLSYLPISSPAAGYETLGDSYDWAREDVLQAMEWPSDKQFNMIADKQSEADIANGLPASYTITQLMPDGTTNVVMDDSGTLPRRFRPTISQNLLDANSRQQERANLEGRAERVKDDLTSARQILYAATEARDSRGVAAAEETIRNLETTLTSMDINLRRFDGQEGIFDGVDATAMREELADLRAPIDESSPTNNFLRGIGEGFGFNIWAELTNSKERRIRELESNLRALGETE
jgi:muramidase (phage lysozyme)